MRYAVGAVALALLVGDTAAAQAPAIAAGSRVRVTAAQADLNKHVATVTDVHGDSLTLAVRGGHRTIALSDVTSLEVSTGQRTRIFVDALLGIGIGAVAGAVVGASSYEECDAEGQLFGCFLAPTSRGRAATEGAIVLGAAGLVTGAIVGLFHRTDVWEGRKLPLTAAVRPSGTGGVTLAFSRGF